MQGRAALDLAGKEPAYRAELNLAGLDLAEASRLLAFKKLAVRGELGGKISVRGRGTGAEAVRRSLSGQGDLTVDQGALTDVNLEQEILSAVGAKFGLPLTEVARILGVSVSSGRDTPFDECRAAFALEKGWVLVREAVLTSKNHGFSAHGRIGLDQALDLQARLILRKVSEQTGRRATYYLVDEQQRKYIPFKVTGTATSPKVRVDLAALVRGQARGLVDQQKKKLEKRLRDKLGPGGEDILKPLDKLFNF